MIKKIIKGYKELFRSLLKVLLLLCFCVITGSAIVLPLWKFSTAYPSVYTYVVLTLIAAAAVFIIIRKIRRNSTRTVLLFLARFFILTGGIFSMVILVLKGYRILSLPVLLVMLFLYGFISLTAKNSQKKELQNESDE